MVRVWCVMALAGILAAASAPSVAQDEDVEVDCDSLERLRIANPESYDEVFCMAASRSGLSSGESRRPVGGASELIIAVNRATFALVRFDGTNNRTYLRLTNVREHTESTLPSLEPRRWGEERRHDRFAVAVVEAKVTDESPYLECVAFLAGLRPAAGAAGYREAVSGIYCAMDTLTPTDAEIAAFLDGLTF